MNEFMIPPDHVNFLAKKLFGNSGKIKDVSIAYLQKEGGGPTEPHTHSHDHLFIVTSGEAKINYGKEIIILKKDESFLVKGTVSHSVWNNIDEETVMVGISVEK
ncbi:MULTISPECIES: cupin domain-containing protein [Porcipelethomonas]|jgi:mannose-6-phosphate isomerase-like protein (cupin superfamily)|uniref:cupin domain-containing protein n=1 Tax=Porcipelethomonas TaxID=2981643 RepID=UPI00082056C6|nr:cupin domain-containing protein [Porcipelethomonas ammoniilytica]MCU6719089.1 cupin domain-containing protein [Porcipelethomonas ammoniilytica]MEE0186984.1 cupin domain-containing protein [Oscillospiraceae bacterium]OLA71933.1 MAG: mannose-6-phosphate isomerase [Ruminococcus sp. 37_24]SCI68977.1 Cupin domain [uncultured Ruminococcus sp.]